MISRFLAILFVFALSASAQAEPLSSLRFQDLNGAAHSLPGDWRSRGGVLILGFAHNARDAMDHWVSALGLRNEDAWIESPVVGDVPAVIRPMIRAGMRSRYDQARRTHVAPVFDGAEPVRRLATPRQGDVVVFVIDHNGEIVARADGAATAPVITRLRSLLPH